MMRKKKKIHIKALKKVKRKFRRWGFAAKLLNRNYAVPERLFSIIVQLLKNRNII